MLKKSKLRNRILVGTFFIIFLLFFINADISKDNYKIGELTIKTEDLHFKVIKDSGYEKDNFDIKVDEKDKKICIQVKPTSIHNTDIDFSLKSKSKLEKEKVKIKKDKDGNYCYDYKDKQIDIDDYLQIGTATIIIAYQEEKRLEYNLDWFNANITLYKDINGEYINNIPDIFVFNKNDSYKFGAIDLNNENISSYKYLVKSSSQIYQNNLQPYISRDIITVWDMFGGNTEQEHHIFDFIDICEKDLFNYSSYPDCKFNYIDDYTIEVTFNSDKNIDPTIEISSDKLFNGNNIYNNITVENGFSHLTIDNTTEPYNSLVFYTPFDIEVGTVTYDYSSLGNDGTLVNNPTFNTTSGYGNCYDFHLSEYITMGDVTFLDGLTSFSISAWIKPAKYTSASHIVSKYYPSGAHVDRMVYLQLVSDGRLYMSISNGSDAGNSSISIKTAPLNKWSYVTAVWNGTYIFLYINATLESTTATPNVNFLNPSNTKNLEIGRCSHASCLFNGSIDEVMIFNTSLNSSQVADIYNNQSKRFKNPGTQSLNNQTYLNITSGYNKVNITTIFNNYVNTNISLFLGFYNGSWQKTSSQNITGNNIFNISTLTTNLTLNFTFLSNNYFYTPNLINTLTLETINDIPENINITITYPLNTTYNINVSNINYTFEGNLDSCWYTIATGTVFSQPNEDSDRFDFNNNIVPSPVPAGDMSGNEYYVKFTSGTYAGNTYQIISAYNLNSWNNKDYFIIDTSLILAGGETFEVYHGSQIAGINFTNVITKEGSNTFTIYCNDTAGNINSSSITFYEDYTNPNAILLNPLNDSYNNSDVNFTANLSDNLGLSGAILHVWKEGAEVLNQIVSVTIGAINGIVGYVWSEIADGIYTWFYEVNDTLNNINYSTNFTLTIDKTNPQVNLTYPLNTTYNINILTIHYDYIDANPGYCWYSNNQGKNNYSVQIAGTNFTISETSNGNYNYTVYCNDSANNQNSSIVFFGVNIPAEEPPTGGGGGGAITQLPISLELCEIIYPFALNNTLFSFDIGNYSKNTVEIYLNNWQIMCSDLINRTLEPKIVCNKLYYLILENPNYGWNDLQIVSLGLSNKLIITPRLLDYYSYYYYDLCYDLNYSGRLPNRPFSMLVIDQDIPIELCDFSTDGYESFIPLFNINLGNISCNKIQFLKLFLQINYLSGSVYLKGIKLWVFLVFITLIIIVSVVYNRKKILSRTK